MSRVDLKAARKAAREAAERAENPEAARDVAEADVPELAGLVLAMAEEVERLRNPNLLRNLEQWDILPGGTYEPAFVARMHAISAALGEAQQAKEERDRLRAEVAGMRPVIDAARGWCDTDGGSPEEGAAVAKLIEAMSEFDEVTEGEAP